MADEELVSVLKQDVMAWNDWRGRHEGLMVNLKGAGLSGARLNGANLNGVDLDGANLSGVDLSGANLFKSSLVHANLSGAILGHAELSKTSFTKANLRGADLAAADHSDASFSKADLSEARLTFATLRKTDLRGTTFTRAIFRETVFANVDLSSSVGLEECVHRGPSSFDIRSLLHSRSLPLAFLRGVGLPDRLIDYLPSLLQQSIQLYSCFISYSAKDEEFVRRLHADLQDNGVRCWFAPEDMKIGAKILDTIDEAIRLREKVLIVLSEASIGSEWVEDEVTKAFEEERQRHGMVLLPVRLDDTVFATKEAWAAKLRANRNIGDFRRWKEHDTYQTTLARLLRDLRVESD